MSAQIKTSVKSVASVNIHFFHNLKCIKSTLIANWIFIFISSRNATDVACLLKVTFFAVKKKKRLKQKTDI
jgi:hypothetical protein